MDILEIHQNIKRSIYLARQLVKEYNDSHDEKILEYLNVVKIGIEELLLKMENFELNIN
jgi:hypothetical protein